MSRRSNIDWEQGRSLFVIKGATQKQVAQALNCSERQVQRRAFRENWALERARFIATSRALTTAESAEAIADATAQDAADLQHQLARVQAASLTAIFDALSISHAVIKSYHGHEDQVTLQDAATLLRIVLRAIALYSSPVQPPADTSVTNIMVQLQSLGVDGRVAVYQHLADPDA